MRRHLIALLFPAIAHAGDPTPTPVDIKPLRDKLVVLEDATGATYVVLPGANGRAWMRASSKQPFYEQAPQSHFADGDAWTITTWAPRVQSTKSVSLERREDGTFHKSCGDKDQVLTLVTADRARPILDSGSFKTSAIVRGPYLLARDEAGVYYYVDKIRDLYGGGGYRVFVGKKGAMKQLPLADVAIDSAGDVFATKSGDVRFVHDADAKTHAVTWVRGSTTTKLVLLDLDVSGPLVFKDLGIYTFLGTLCDDI